MKRSPEPPWMTIIHSRALHAACQKQEPPPESVGRIPVVPDERRKSLPDSYLWGWVPLLWTARLPSRHRDQIGAVFMQCQRSLTTSCKREAKRYTFDSRVEATGRSRRDAAMCLGPARPKSSDK
jgi:hypothetical protein